MFMKKCTWSIWPLQSHTGLSLISFRGEGSNGCENMPLVSVCGCTWLCPCHFLSCHCITSLNVMQWHWVTDCLFGTQFHGSRCCSLRCQACFTCICKAWLIRKHLWRAFEYHSKTFNMFLVMVNARVHAPRASLCWIKLHAGGPHLLLSCRVTADSLSCQTKPIKPSLFMEAAGSAAVECSAEMWRLCCKRSFEVTWVLPGPVFIQVTQFRGCIYCSRDTERTP